MPYTELIEDRLRIIEIDESDIVELQQAREYTGLPGVQGAL